MISSLLLDSKYPFKYLDFFQRLNDLNFCFNVKTIMKRVIYEFDL